MIDTLPEPPAALEQVIERKLLDCGLKAGGFTVRYEDYLQSVEVVILPPAGATPVHFACIREAAFPEIVTFEDRAMFRQYLDFEAELVRPQVLADAETALKEYGRWEGFPRRAGFASLNLYAHALEWHLGFAPGSLYKVSGDALEFDPPREDFLAARSLEHYAPVMAAMSYASASDRVRFFIIGNEKVAE